MELTGSHSEVLSIAKQIISSCLKSLWLFVADSKYWALNLCIQEIC